MSHIINCVVQYRARTPYRADINSSLRALEIIITKSEREQLRLVLMRANRSSSHLRFLVARYATIANCPLVMTQRF